MKKRILGQPPRGLDSCGGTTDQPAQTRRCLVLCGDFAIEPRRLLLKTVQQPKFIFRQRRGGHQLTLVLLPLQQLEFRAFRACVACVEVQFLGAAPTRLPRRHAKGSDFQKQRRQPLDLHSGQWLYRFPFHLAFRLPSPEPIQTSLHVSVSGIQTVLHFFEPANLSCYFRIRPRNAHEEVGVRRHRVVGVDVMRQHHIAH